MRGKARGANPFYLFVCLFIFIGKDVVLRKKRLEAKVMPEPRGADWVPPSSGHN